VWDGFQELVEIQQLGGDNDPIENDTTTLHRGAPDGIDQNPFIGRVLYTYGNVLDQPLSLTRVAYADSVPLPGSPQPWVLWQPFSFLPLWNHLGEVDRAMFGAGAAPCQTVNGVQRCVIGAWPFGWSALQVPEFIQYYWHGTVTENKRDKAQTLYKRYRVYDPLTGRFTQEDPIGLAGGLNAYGFAAGDPINFSDPFGLCADSLKNRDGRCPGGLTDEQWRRVEYAANNRMTRTARERVLRFLNSGKIRAVAEFPGRKAADARNLTNTIRIEEAAFDYQPGNLAALLAHESQHTVQPFLMMFSPTMPDRDADAYACANTWGRTGSYVGGLYGNRYGNYCGGS
jgi:RHS repeat-associated protein